MSEENKTGPDNGDAAPSATQEENAIVSDNTTAESQYNFEEKNKLLAFGGLMVEVSAVLGTVTMPIENFMKLGRGAIIELPRHKDDNIDLYVNGRIVAKGEVMVVKDNVGVSVTKVLKKKSRAA